MFLSEYIERAIVEIGYAIDIHDWYKMVIPGRIRDRLPFLNSWDLKRINVDLIHRVKKSKPDILIVSGGWTIYPKTISKIRNLGNIITVNWIADYPRMFDVHLKTGPYYNYFFTSSSDALRRYKDAGYENGYWLPFACDPGIQRPLQLTVEEREKYGNDICFVGSMYSERVEVLECLCDFDLGIWGLGWERLAKNSPLRKFIRGGVVKPEEWVKIYNSSKIGLNIVTDFLHLNPEKRKLGFANMRVFEILGCGAFQIIDKKRDVLALFNPNEHLVVYENIDDLKSLILYYLKNEDERKRIAENGKRIALEKHTYKHRIEEMFAIIKAGNKNTRTG